MGETATTTLAEDRKKKGKAAAEPVKTKAKAKTKNKVKKDKAAKPAKKARSKARESFDGLAKLVDHPLVADLLAAGAIAAVTAIAEHRLEKGKGQSSSKMVKSVGKAAAAAMGKKLMGEIDAITTAATDAAKKV